MTKAERLSQIQRRTTKYEVVAIRADGARRLVGYTVGKSGHGLLRLARSHGGALVAWMKVTDDDAFTFGVGRRSMKFGSHTIQFTGRTERDSIIEGEVERVSA